MQPPAEPSFQSFTEKWLAKVWGIHAHTPLWASTAWNRVRGVTAKTREEAVTVVVVATVVVGVVGLEGG